MLLFVSWKSKEKSDDMWICHPTLGAKWCFSVSLADAHESTNILIIIYGPMAPQSAHLRLLRSWPGQASSSVTPTLP